jgi:hypothetical protein
VLIVFFVFLRGFALVLSLAVATASPLCPVSGFDTEGPAAGLFQDVTKGSELNDALIPCPQCGSEDVVKIVYGYPTEETLEKAEAGEVHLGGCVIGHFDPNRYCKHCGHEWLQQ